MTMRGRGYQIGISLLLLSFGLPIAAIADPIVPRSATLKITTGQLRFDHDSDDPLAEGVLSGLGFSLFLRLEDTSRSVGPPLSLTSRLAAGTLTVNGADLNLTGGTFHTEGSARPTDTPRTIVTPIQDNQFFGTVTYPFSLSVGLFGRDRLGTTYRFNLQGRGIARSEWLGFGTPDRGIGLFSSLEFGKVAETPEPATWLLLLCGVLVAGCGSCRRTVSHRYGPGHESHRHRRSYDDLLES